MNDHKKELQHTIAALTGMREANIGKHTAPNSEERQALEKAIAILDVIQNSALTIEQENAIANICDATSADSINIKATLDLTLSRQDITDIIVTALEGGIGYWACLDNRSDAFVLAPENEPESITAANLILDGKAILLIDEEEKLAYTFTLESLAKGVRLWIEQALDRYHAVSTGRIDTSEIDAEMADMIFQLGIFDEVVYG